MNKKGKKNGSGKMDIPFWSAFPMERRPSVSYFERIQNHFNEVPNLPPIREMVFTDELRKLADAVVGHEKRDLPSGPQTYVGEVGGSSLPSIESIRMAGKREGAEPVPGRAPEGDLPHPVEIQSLFRQSGTPYPESIMEALDLLARYGEIQESHFHPLSRYILSRSGAVAMAWVVMDPRYYTARVLVSSGLDSLTRRNLFIGLNDLFLEKNREYQLLSFRGNLGNNFNFRKRFGSEFFLKHEGALFINLETLNMKGYLTLFYRHLHGIDGEGVYNGLLPLIRDMLPYLNGYGIHHWKETFVVPEHHEILYNIYRILKELSSHGKDSVQVLYISLDSLLEENSWKTILSTGSSWLCQKLHPEERLVVVAPCRLVALLKYTDPQVVLQGVRELSNSWGIPFRHALYSYPDDGHNLYNYIHSMLRVGRGSPVGVRIN